MRGNGGRLVIYVVAAGIATVGFLAGLWRGRQQNVEQQMAASKGTALGIVDHLEQWLEAEVVKHRWHELPEQFHKKLASLRKKAEALPESQGG